MERFFVREKLINIIALPDYLRNPTLSIDVFKRYLKTFLFAQY